MEATEILDEADIVFSDSAASRVAQLIKEEKNPELRLRVYITGGGCSGFSYGFTFDENLKEGDSGVNKKGVQLVIDPMSYQYLMEATEILDEADIVFSDSAASRVAQLIKEEKNPELRLRVYITGGGCSGFSYGFTFDENLKEGDSGVNKKGVQLVIDPMSYQYLMGSTVDYLEDLQGARFVVSNPNAKTTCGCGSSFSI